MTDLLPMLGMGLDAIITHSRKDMAEPIARYRDAVMLCGSPDWERREVIGGAMQSNLRRYGRVKPNENGRVLRLRRKT